MNNITSINTTASTKSRAHIDFNTRFAIAKMLESVVERQGNVSFYRDGWNDSRVASNFPSVKPVQVSQLRKNMFPDFARRYASSDKARSKVAELRTLIESQQSAIERQQTIIEVLTDRLGKIEARIAA